MMKRVLLYSAKFMNIYLDIKKGLEDMGYDVEWIEANTVPNNPFNKTLGLYSEDKIDAYLYKASEKWKSLLVSDKFSRPFDFFISVVGIDIPPFVFEELSRSNPQIRKVLYLYDRVEGVYQIDRFFKYYDEVFSFDKGDCRQFKLTFLPIYWIPVSTVVENLKYDIFAFASYSELKQDRTALFSELKKIADNNNYSDFIKLYDRSYGTNKTVFIVKSLVNWLLKRNTLTMKDISVGLITGKSVEPDEYRQLINQSRVVFDTQAPYQDGLTARFMWALGAGKKIITTNPHIKTYEFYDKNQFFVLDNNINEIESFVNNPFEPSSLHKEMIEPYRIDNWVKTLLDNAR